MTADEQPPSPTKTYLAWLASPAGKAGLILGLLLLMQIPLYLVSGLISEREGRQDEVLAGFRRTWGPQQTVSGPILAVPYLEPATGEVNTHPNQERAWLHIPPTQISVSAKLEPETRRRGLFHAVVYTASVGFNGTITVPRIEIPDVPATDILWDQAVLVMTASDLRGQPAEAMADVNGHTTRQTIQSIMNPICGKVSIPAQISGPPQPGSAMPFRASLVLHGTQSLSLVPYGQQTDLTMSAPWRSPGFIGSTLPFTYGIARAGFHAEWQIAGDAVSGAWHLDSSPPPFCAVNNDERAVGVELLEAVPTYLMVSRAAKYGMLFLALSFLTYFIFEGVSRVRIHLMQYALLGLSVSLFALLLIALAEPLGFTPGYALSTVAVMAQATLYTLSVVGSTRLAMMFALVLGLLFGFLYIVLCLETFSLLVGSVALFGALSVVMFVTRHLDWSGHGNAALWGEP